MITINDIINEDILDKLNNIAGVSVLSGYMVHYADDLLAEEGGITFPAVAVQPVNDEIIWAGDKPLGKLDHNLLLIGAVSSKDRSAVNTKLNELLFKVRKALHLAQWSDNKDSKSVSILTSGASFNLPKGQHQYAYFELRLIIKYVEKYE